MTERKPETDLAPLVEFGCDVSQVPESILEAAASQLRQVCSDVARIHPSSPFWDSLGQRGLNLTLEGWRFTYRFRQPDELVVIAVAYAGEGWKKDAFDS